MKKITILLVSGLFILSPFHLLAQNITTIAGNGVAGYSGDGSQATTAELNYESGVAVDGSGNLYIADQKNNVIRKVSTLGVITTYAGTGAQGYSGDGGQATNAELYYTPGLAVDRSGNIYVADYQNSRIRKVTTSGVITTVAGNGTSGYIGDGVQATATEINLPTGVAVDTLGNIYIADYQNSRIRKVSTSGVISTIAGNGTAGYLGDGGQATNAELNNPWGVTVDKAGNIYVADRSNNVIRKVNPSGIISTFAGTGTAGYTGDGGQATDAELDYTPGVAIDNSGNVYVVDQHNNVIREVNNSGIINTIAGDGTQGFSGDGGAATAAEMYYPSGVTVDKLGAVYIADQYNQRVRKIASVEGVDALSYNSINVTCFPNPTHGTIYLNNMGASLQGQFIVLDMAGRVVLTKQMTLPTSGIMEIDANSLDDGMYLYRIIPAKGSSIVGKFIIEK